MTDESDIELLEQAYIDGEPTDQELVNRWLSIDELLASTDMDFLTEDEREFYNLLPVERPHLFTLRPKLE